MTASTRLTLLTRIGFAARALLYVVIALSIIRGGRAEDTSGALEQVGDATGQWLLGIIAAGLLGYGLWRLCDAAFDIERRGSGRKAIVNRLGAALSGLVHMLLAWQAVRLILGSAATGDATQARTQTMLQLPGGVLLVTIAGALLIAVGIMQLVKAIKGSFLRHLEPRIAREPWAQWSGRAGYAARGLVFLICGVFVVTAGLEARASEAGGMAQALAWLTSPFDILVAAGLLCFGAFSLVEARFRVLQDVKVDGIVRRITR